MLPAPAIKVGNIFYTRQRSTKITYISTFFMYSMAIICVFFISANNICLHCITKMNKLLHKLSCIICFITKSSSQLNPLLFSVFLSLPTYWLFMLFSLLLCFLLLSRHAIHLSLLWQWNLLWFVLYFNQIAAIVNNLLYQVVRLFGLFVIVVSLQRSGILSVYRQSIAAVVVEFTSDCLVVLSNCRHSIRSVLWNCRVIWSFCHYCFIEAF